MHKHTVRHHRKKALTGVLQAAFVEMQSTSTNLTVLNEVNYILSRLRKYNLFHSHFQWTETGVSICFGLLWISVFLIHALSTFGKPDCSFYV